MNEVLKRLTKRNSEPAIGSLTASHQELPEPAPVDKQRLERSLAFLWEIYQDISRTADEVSQRRCPYKNAQDRCTARFGCRNQLRDDPDQLPLCTGSDKLDYRSAWEVDEAESVRQDPQEGAGDWRESGGD